MSSSNLSRVAKSILRDLKTNANKAKKSTRKELEKQEGQILIINRKRFSDNLIELIPSLGGKEKQKVRDEIWEKYSSFLTKLETKVDPDRLKVLKSTKIVGKRANDHIFYIKNYRSAVRAKGLILKRIIQQSVKRLSKKETENLSKIGGSTNKFGAQLGHAEERANGKTIGFAASTVRVAAAKEKISNLERGKDKVSLMKGISQYENEMKITLDHKQLVEKGKIKKEYIPVISWQTAVSNQELSDIEQVALKNFQNYLKNIVDNPGSTSLKDAIGQVMLYELSKGKGKKKVTGKKSRKVSSKGRGKAKGKVKSKRNVAVTRDSTLPKSLKEKRIPSKGPASEVLQLIGIINQKLPSQVEANMKPPALQYRTGRFANSVRVTDVAVTPQGFPSVGYTYQRNPYETFEPGNLQGSIERDPRKLIDKSIREIAAQFAIGRFYTRRV